MKLCGTLWVLVMVTSARWLIPTSIAKNTTQENISKINYQIPSSVPPQNQKVAEGGEFGIKGRVCNKINNRNDILNTPSQFPISIMPENKTVQFKSSERRGHRIKDIVSSGLDGEEIVKSAITLWPNVTMKSSQVTSLFGLLIDVMKRELSQCNLVLAYDPDDIYSIILPHLLLMLPNQRQVVLVRSEDDLTEIRWIWDGCTAYLILLENPEPFITFANILLDIWDYNGRFVVVMNELQQLEQLSSSRKGKKTQHILGIIKGKREGEWRMHTNQLYWKENVVSITTWLHNRYTSQANIFPDKIADLKGVSLKVSTFEFEPSIMYYHGKNGSLLYRYGEDIAIVETIARVLNFTPIFAEPMDGELWGNKVNGQWTGMNGELARGEVDMGVANFFVSLTNLVHLDFSAPYKAEAACFMARTEPPLPRWQALAFPFHPYTWLAIFVGFLLYGPFLFLLTTAVNKYGMETSSMTSLIGSWYYTTGLHFREPQTSLPRMSSTRVFVVFLLLYTMIITIAYSTNLTAFLLVQKPPTSIQSIRDLYESGLEVASLGEIFVSSISLASDTYLRGLLTVFKAYVSQEEIMEKVMEGHSVLLENRGHLEFHTATHLSNQGAPKLRILKECFAPYSIAMVLQKHSPLKSKVDVIIGWLQQSGLIHHYFRQSLRLAATTQEYGGDEDVGDETGHDGEGLALNLDHMQGVFMLVAVGLFTAFIIFLIELCILYKKK